MVDKYLCTPALKASCLIQWLEEKTTKAQEKDLTFI
jgi:hypothetical protein